MPRGVAVAEQHHMVRALPTFMVFLVACGGDDARRFGRERTAPVGDANLVADDSQLVALALQRCGARAGCRELRAEILDAAVGGCQLGGQLFGVFGDAGAVGLQRGDLVVQLLSLAPQASCHVLGRLQLRSEIRAARLAGLEPSGQRVALVAEGWETVEVDAAPELADSVFVEDTVVLFGDLAVITSPGADSRRPEIDAVERTVRAVPGLTVARIEAPGTLEGGDVLKVGATVYVGASSRTNAEGIRQLRALLTPHGYEVVAVPVTKALHLKSTMTALPDGTIIGDPDLVDVPSLFPSFLPVPEPEGVAVVELSPDSLLMSASAPRTAQMLSTLGYRVVTVDIGEFEKLEGCVTCLSVRVR